MTYEEWEAAVPADIRAQYDRAFPVYGFSGCVLHIDLTSGRSAHHELEQSRLRKYIGGGGLGTSLLYDYAPQGVDPLSPEAAQSKVALERLR